MERIIKAERDTQSRAIDTILKAFPHYHYLGNLAASENTNIREEELRHFLVRRQGYDDFVANEAIRMLREFAVCGEHRQLYDQGMKTYQCLRNGENVSQGYGKTNKHIHYIDWEHPLNNDFAVAEEVTVRRVTEDLKHRRPDIVIYVNGIALVVLELKRADVSVAEAIRQNRRNQEDGEICLFFTTVQLLLAGNESEGIKYGVTGTPEKYWLRWKEPSGEPCEPSEFTQRDYPNEMFRSLLQILEPKRLLEFIHDCILYDGGIKKTVRPNQYFALVAAKARVRRREGGIIWHSQGAGKSLMMVWLAQWIREQGDDARVVIVTDRDELDKQIENGFKATGEVPRRVRSGVELIHALNTSGSRIICTLIHKFGVGLHADSSERIQVGERVAKRSVEECMEQIACALPVDFHPKGKVFVFVDECHRTQGGILHQAMKKIMGDDVMIIGFTGTPLLQDSKITTLEQFGSYIHTYKFDEAVQDGVILDLRYEARNIEQLMDANDKKAIDQIFEARTHSMTDQARNALRDRWAILRNVYSSDARIRKIVADICKDMILLKPLAEGYGNAMLVAGSIYQAYKFWDAFEGTDLRGKTAVVSSYDPQEGVSIQDGHSSDAVNDEETFKCNTAKRMMGDRSAEQFEEWAKNEFITKPGSMKLLIVVDKLLTGFDAPHATYLYIDKKMEEHNLFQAICRVNRVDNEWKEFGYIVDYKDLFNEIKEAVEDYTNGAFAGYDKKDVEGLLKNRLEQGKKDLDQALEIVEGICQNVKYPQVQDDFFNYFVFDQTTTPVDKQHDISSGNAGKRERFYQAIQTLESRYLAIAGQMTEAGYSVEEAKTIHEKVSNFDSLKKAIMLRAGDFVDLKQYNAMMRQLLDQYVQAPRSELLEKLEDLSFLDVIIVKGDDDIADELDTEEKRLGGRQAAAEALSANARKIIMRKRDANPDYYDKLSERLNKILEGMKAHTEEYHETLKKLIAVMRDLKENARHYHEWFDTDGKKAILDNLDGDEELAKKVYGVVIQTTEQGFRDSGFAGKAKCKKITQALEELGLSTEKANILLTIIIHNPEF